MKTIICIALLSLIALTYASALPAPDGDTNLESSDVIPPAAIEGEELQPEESRWGHGGWGRGYGGGYGGWGGGYDGWGRGYGGWGGGYGGYGGWGRGYGGWGRGYGGRGWGWGR